MRSVHDAHLPTPMLAPVEEPAHSCSMHLVRGLHQHRPELSGQLCRDMPHKDVMSLRDDSNRILVMRVTNLREKLQINRAKLRLTRGLGKIPPLRFSKALQGLLVVLSPSYYEVLSRVEGDRLWLRSAMKKSHPRRVAVVVAVVARRGEVIE